mgnify:CR=1 FL=1
MAKNYRPITLPDGVQMQVDQEKVTLKGKLGSGTVAIPAGLSVVVEKGGVSVTAQSGSPRAMVGTLRAHIISTAKGVSSGYTKIVELRGMGYRAQKTKDGVKLACGYSHEVEMTAPAGVDVDVKQVPNPDDPKEQMFEITVSGTDKHAVGDVAAKIRRIRRPDPYHGKGFRYRGERVRKKAGKRAVGTQA